MEFDYIIAEESVAVYEATHGVFGGLIKEVRILSSKKPDATMSKGKVKIVNRVLSDLKAILDVEPEGKFLDLLDDDALPQNSDAVLIMVQYETALKAFYDRYRRYVEWEYGKREWEWITPKLVKEHKEMVEERRARWADAQNDEE